MNADSMMKRACLAAALSILNEGDGDEPPPGDVGTCVTAPAELARLTTFAVPQADAYVARFPRDVRAALRCAVETARAELERRGFRPVDRTESPDLHLFAVAGSRDKTSEHWGCVGGFWLATSGWQWDP